MSVTTVKTLGTTLALVGLEGVRWSGELWEAGE